MQFGVYSNFRETLTFKQDVPLCEDLVEPVGAPQPACQVFAKGLLPVSDL